MVDRIAADRPGSLFMQALDEVIKREQVEVDEVRAEIAQKGTYWAGDEIWRLRRRVVGLRKQLANKETNK